MKNRQTDKCPFCKKDSMKLYREKGQRLPKGLFCKNCCFIITPKFETASMIAARKATAKARNCQDSVPPTLMCGVEREKPATGAERATTAKPFPEALNRAIANNPVGILNGLDDSVT